MFLLFLLCNEQGKIDANDVIMTKCHLFLTVLATAFLAGCAANTPDKSLSEYASSSQSAKLQAFRQYAESLDTLSLEQATALQEERLAVKDSAAFQEEYGFQRLFFFDPNSPYRNEDYMVPVLGKVAESAYATQEQRTQAGYFLPLFSLNRKGTVAADFAFTLKNGRTRSLHSVKGELKLLFFSNPGCEDCRRVTEALSANPVVQDMIAGDQLTVVNIYPDADIDAWLEHLSDYPQKWVCGYAPEVDDIVGDALPLYYLRAIPSLYLLDSENRVLLKDAPVEKVIWRICRK